MTTQATWLNENSAEKRQAIGQWVESLSEKEYSLLEAFASEIRERAMMELIQEIEQSPIMKTVNQGI